MLSSSGVIINTLLDKWKIPNIHGAQTKALPLNVKHRILRNKMVEQNNLDEPLWND